MENSGHQLRCTGCARVIEQSDLKENFRCAECGDLYEVVYTSWSAGMAEIRKPNASAMRTNVGRKAQCETMFVTSGKDIELPSCRRK